MPSIPRPYSAGPYGDGQYSRWIAPTEVAAGGDMGFGGGASGSRLRMRTAGEAGGLVLTFTAAAWAHRTAVPIIGTACCKEGWRIIRRRVA